MSKHTILGKPIPEKNTELLKAECRKLCGWERETFPGSQPVSLARRNLQSLIKMPYVVCEKSDGERFLLLNQNNETFMIDRKFAFYRVDLKAYFKETSKISLLDGELITDGTGTNGETNGTVRYLIYDAVHIYGESVRDLPLLERLHKVQLLVKNSVSGTSSSLLPSFPMYLKDFFHVKHSLDVYCTLAKRLPHYCDGLIFTPMKLPYIPGTCRQLLKWKPAELNTVDFTLKIIFNLAGRRADQAHVDFHGMLLSAEGGVQTFKGFWLGRGGETWEWLQENTAKANNKVVECQWREDVDTFVPNNKSVFTDQGEWVKGGWVLMRLREDRTTPNDISVVEKVKDSIRDGIGVEELGKILRNVQDFAPKKPRVDDHH